MTNDISQYPLSEKIRVAGEAWAKQDGIAETSKDYAEALFDELSNQSQESTQTAKEREARLNPKYKEALLTHRREKTKANLLKIRWKSAEAAFEEWKEINANMRSEARAIGS